ncbi:MAG TPA: DUF4395 domain-containing protein [Acidimicrobiales bacterium]|nr:DUF4395 domain-containing protein [Acidimicrobiales bacterium]
MARLLSFPNPVNEKAARTVAAGVVALAVATLSSRQLLLTVPLAYGFVARAASGPRFSPLGQLATRVIAPRLGAPKPVPGPPKRFAQLMGAAFTLAALCCFLAGERTAAFVLVATLLAPALLESALGYCIGCELFGLGMRLGIVPASVCEECLDLSKRRHLAGA